MPSPLVTLLALEKIKQNITIEAHFNVAVVTGSPTCCRSHLMHFLHLDVQVDGFAVKL